MKKTISRFFPAVLLAALILTACGPVDVYITPEEPVTSEVVESGSMPEVAEPEPVFDFVVHEQARDLAVAYAAERAGVETPTGSWSTQDATPEGLVGSSAFLNTNLCAKILVLLNGSS